MECNIITGIISGSFGIIGAITGWALTRLTQNEIVRKNNFLTAAKIFRESFSEEYSFLIKPVSITELGFSKNQVHKLVDKWMEKHIIAIINFQHYLKPNKIKAFRNAYQQYCYPNPDFPDNPRIDYHSEGSSNVIEYEIMCRTKLRERMEKLFEFAKY